MVIRGCEDCALSYGNLGLNADAVYVFYQYLNLQPYKSVEVKYESEFSVGGVDFTFGDGYSVLAECDGIDVAVCAGDFCPFESCDLLISDEGGLECESKFSAYFNARENKYNTYDCGDIKFKLSDRTLYLTGYYPECPYIC